MYNITEQDQLYGPEKTIEKSWKRFHEKNPHVYENLVKLSRQWRQHNPNKKLGIGMLFEALRWDSSINTEGEELKLNNNYRSYYARLIMKEPGLEGLFKTRKLRG